MARAGPQPGVQPAWQVHRRGKSRIRIQAMSAQSRSAMHALAMTLFATPAPCWLCGTPVAALSKNRPVTPANCCAALAQAAHCGLPAGICFGAYTASASLHADKSLVQGAKRCCWNDLTLVEFLHERGTQTDTQHRVTRVGTRTG